MSAVRRALPYFALILLLAVAVGLFALPAAHADPLPAGGATSIFKGKHAGVKWRLHFYAERTQTDPYQKAISARVILRGPTAKVRKLYGHKLRLAFLGNRFTGAELRVRSCTVRPDLRICRQYFRVRKQRMRENRSKLCGPLKLTLLGERGATLLAKQGLCPSYRITPNPRPALNPHF